MAFSRVNSPTLSGLQNWLFMAPLCLLPCPMYLCEISRGCQETREQGQNEMKKLAQQSIPERREKKKRANPAEARCPWNSPEMTTSGEVGCLQSHCPTINPLEPSKPRPSTRSPLVQPKPRPRPLVSPYLRTMPPAPSKPRPRPPGVLPSNNLSLPG